MLFNCLRKGHLAKNCSDRKKVICKYCKGKHHSALCVESQGNVETQENQRVPVNIESVGMTTTGNSMLVSTGNSVALQTAQAQIAGKGTSRVRVLFDTASHKSFVTSRVVKSFELETLRREWLTGNTFGQRATGSNFRDVVGIDLTPVGGGKVMRIEAFVVPEILGDEQLEIDLLIGADYLWSFQTGNVVRGKVNEPVAVQTELGWVISGPLSYEQPAYRAQEVQVNFVGSDSIMTESLERNVQRLWDLKALGIAGSSKVYEDFIDSIAFNGTRYSVKLPWKEGHNSLPSYYELSLSCMKGQIRKLRKEPEVLEEYNEVIKEQFTSGVIESVTELERADKEASTTKVPVVYDASAKLGKGGTSLNYSLHVGPSLNPLLFDILVRFREKRVALVGDIEKAFLNIEVAERDRDCLRFLWCEDVHKPDSKIVVYRFCRIVSGLNASPFLLNARLRYHISKYKLKMKAPNLQGRCSKGFMWTTW